MFVTNWISTTKIQKISEITNFFRHYFLSRTEVYIGPSVCLIEDVTIGHDSQIGAGSVVTKDIPPFSVAVGNPAKVIKKYNLTTMMWEKYID